MDMRGPSKWVQICHVSQAKISPLDSVGDRIQGYDFEAFYTEHVMYSFSEEPLWAFKLYVPGKGS